MLHFYFHNNTVIVKWNILGERSISAILHIIPHDIPPATLTAHLLNWRFRSIGFIGHTLIYCGEHKEHLWGKLKMFGVLLRVERVCERHGHTVRRNLRNLSTEFTGLFVPDVMIILCLLLTSHFFCEWHKRRLMRRSVINIFYHIYMYIL